MAQQYFIGRDPADAQDRAIAQQERYVQQANLVAGRADQQAAQDNAFAFSVRNQLANEEAQRYQFGVAEAARAKNEVTQERDFTFRQSQANSQEARANSQEARANAQSKREDEKFMFDKGRLERVEKQRTDNSEYLVDSFAATLGPLEKRIADQEDIIKPTAEKVSAINAEARSLGLMLDKSGQWIPLTNTPRIPGSEAATKSDEFALRVAPELDRYRRAIEQRNMLENQRAEILKYGREQGILASGERESLTVRDTATGRTKPAFVIPAQPPVDTTTALVIERIRSLNTQPQLQRIAIDRAVRENKITAQQGLELGQGR